MLPKELDQITLISGWSLVIIQVNPFVWAEAQCTCGTVKSKIFVQLSIKICRSLTVTKNPSHDCCQLLVSMLRSSTLSRTFWFVTDALRVGKRGLIFLKYFCKVILSTLWLLLKLWWGSAIWHVCSISTNSIEIPYSPVCICLADLFWSNLQSCNKKNAHRYPTTHLLTSR